MFAGTFAASDHEQTFSLMLSTPGVWLMVAKAWPSVLKVLDPKKREEGFSDLRRFGADEKAAEPTNLAEIIDGAGGTLEHLAHLIVLYPEEMVPAPGRTIHFMYVRFTEGILDFIIRVEPTLSIAETAGEPLGALGTALASRNIIHTLIKVVCALAEATSSQAGDTLEKSLVILGSILMATRGQIQ
jgi:hypothetical protein